jgi:hypothetical protein
MFTEWVECGLIICIAAKFSNLKHAFDDFFRYQRLIQFLQLVYKSQHLVFECEKS